MIDASPRDPDLMTTDEVISALLGDPFLRRRAVTCVLPAVHCGKDVRFRRSDLDAWIRELRARERKAS
jgi:hypothetical protein